MAIKFNLSDRDVEKIVKGCLEQSDKYGLPRRKRKKKTMKK